MSELELLKHADKSTVIWAAILAIAIAIFTLNPITGIFNDSYRTAKSDAAAMQLKLDAQRDINKRLEAAIAMPESDGRTNFISHISKAMDDDDMSADEYAEGLRLFELIEAQEHHKDEAHYDKRV